MFPQDLIGYRIVLSNRVEDGQAIWAKSIQTVFMGQLLYLHTKWALGGTIDDFIEWRCAHYSRQIDKKYYL
jgi:hypothetical protein